MVGVYDIQANMSVCKSFKPGHSVHWIQMRLAMQTPGVPVRIHDVDGAQVTAEIDGEREIWHLHDTFELAARLTEAARDGRSWVDGRLHGHGMLALEAGDGQLPVLLYPARPGTEWQPCAGALLLDAEPRD